MKKIVLSSITAIFAALLISSAALAATLDNLQVQIDKNSATINVNSTKPAPAPAPVTKKDDDDHKDNGKHLGQKKHDKKD